MVTGLLYLVVLQQVKRGLSRLESGEHEPQPRRSPAARVSVIIPCRNEAQHIAGALEDLSRQDYPWDHVEIIVVDDRSNDGTGDIARGFIGRIPRLKVLRVDSCPETSSPKMHALLCGLEAAQGEIIVTTDGDCRFSPGWISSLISPFDPQVGMVAGLTVFDRGREEPLWQRLQQLDFLSHSFFAAGAIGRGWAFNCNGSNLALRREAFTQVGGYQQFQQVITGDDTLLLQRLRQHGQWQVRFSAAPDSLVRSWPEETPAAVLHQRLRWGSGGLSYSPAARAFALSTFFFFAALLLSPIFWLLGWINEVWMVLLLLKILQESRVMSAGFRVFRLPADWAVFLLLELLHIPAILTFSLGGHLFGFRWKGEHFQRRRNPSPVYSQARVP